MDFTLTFKPDDDLGGGGDSVEYFGVLRAERETLTLTCNTVTFLSQPKIVSFNQRYVLVFVYELSPHLDSLLYRYDRLIDFFNHLNVGLTHQLDAFTIQCLQ